MNDDDLKKLKGLIMPVRGKVDFQKFIDDDLLPYFSTFEERLPDLIELDKICENWNKVVPKLEYFENILPTINRDIMIQLIVFDIKNHLKLTSKKVFREKLINKLLSLTKELLRKINTAEMVKMGLIKEANQVGLEIGIEKHRIKQLCLLEEFSTGEEQYLDVINKWLNNETIFFRDEIKPRLEVIPKLHSLPEKIKDKPPKEFPSEMVEVVRQALKEKKLLTDSGCKYIGRTKTPIKALFNVLHRRSYFGDIPKKEEAFSKWFEENFCSKITGRTLRNNPGKGQEEEEAAFKSLIPEKK